MKFKELFYLVLIFVLVAGAFYLAQSFLRQDQPTPFVPETYRLQVE